MKTIKNLLICLVLIIVSVFKSYAQFPPCNYNPLISITASGGSATFVATATSAPAAVDYYWNYGDGNTGFGATSVHTYAASGTYTVCLALFDSLAFCMDTVCSTITVVVATAPCNASFTTSFITNTLLQFNNTSSATGPYTSYWDFGDGTTSTVANPTHSYATSGTYNVCLVITSGGCIDSFCMPVTAFAPSSCNASFTYLANSPNTATFNNTSSVAGVMQTIWDFGDGSTQVLYGNVNPTHTYATPGIYNVCIVVIDTVFPCIDSFCDSVIITGTLLPCNASFISNINLNTANFTSTSTGVGLTYLWWFGDGFTSTMANPIHTYSLPGLYNVCLFVIDSSNACIDSVCSNVTILPPTSCNAQFTATINGCNAILTNTTTGSYNSGLWLLGNGSTQLLSTTNNVVTTSYPTNGVYNVCLVVIDTLLGCIDSFCSPIVIFGCATAVDGFSNNHSVNLYPNPTQANAYLDIVSTKVEPIFIHIVDIMGKSLYSNQFNLAKGTNKVSIPVENFATGQYIIRLTDSQAMSKVFKLQKN